MSTTTPPAPDANRSTKNPAPTHPFIDTSVPSINSAPVELDSTPVSPVSRKDSWKTKGASSTSNVISPDADEEAYGELSGERGLNEVVRQKRKELLEERSRDPAVLVEIPQTPRAEEYEIAEGTVANTVVSRAREPMTAASETETGDSGKKTGG